MIKQGTIVLIPFPFTDLSDSKVRPVLIISKPSKNSDITVVFISSQKEKAGVNDVVIAPSKENGLKTPSIIKCSKIATLDKKLLLGELGTVSIADYKKVQNSLKSFFL